MDKTEAKRAHLIGAFDLYGKSSALVKKNLHVFGWIYAGAFLITILSWFDSSSSNQGRFWWFSQNFNVGWNIPSLPDYPWGVFLGLTTLWVLIVVAGGIILSFMKTATQLEASRGRTLQFSHVWDYVKKYWLRLIGLYVLIFLFVVGGLILFIVPGLIMIRRYFLAPYVLLDQDTGIRDAMRRSADMSKPYSGSIWRIIGVMFLISLLNVIPILGWLGAFILGMFYSVAPALRYQELKKLS